MRCPKCTRRMRQFTAASSRPDTGEGQAPSGDIHLDRCDTCKGTWYDYGELALLVGQDPGALGLAVGQPSMRPTCVGCGAMTDPGAMVCAYCGASLAMGCPRCNAPLYSIRLGGFHLESCAQCHGMWLDDGEAMAIAAAVRGGSQSTQFGTLTCGTCGQTGFNAQQVYATQNAFICKRCDAIQRQQYAAAQQRQNENVERAVIGAVVLGGLAGVVLDFF